MYLIYDTENTDFDWHLNQDDSCLTHTHRGTEDALKYMLVDSLSGWLNTLNKMDLMVRGLQKKKQEDERKSQS
jgi:hypothetical protein